MKKYFYLIMTLLIICLSILIVLLLVYVNNKSKVKPDEGMISSPGENLSFELNNKIFPQDYLTFESKTKNLKIDHDEIYKSLYRFVRNAEQLKNDTSKLSEKELKEYYNYNYKTMHLRGIRSEDDFVKIINSLRKIYSDSEVYYRNVKIIVNDKKENSYEIDIEYNNNKTIKLNLVIENAEKSIFKFVPIVEE